MHTTEPWAGAFDGRLIVVLSSERSGSTLLRVLLGSHPRIIAPQELFLLRYPDFETWRERKSVAMESLVELFRLLGRPLSEAEIEAACRGRSTVDVYKWLFGFLPPDALLVDKTPAYANDPSTLVRSAALAPFYIWLIRHPLGVIDSHVRLKEKERRSRPLPGRVLHPLRDAVERWTDGMTALGRQREAKWALQNRNVYEFLRDVPSQRKALVYFEEFVRDPDATVRTLCSGLGIEPAPGMTQLEAPQVMNPNLGDPNFHLHRRVDTQPAESWRARYSEAQLQAETRQLMQQIGIRTRPRDSRTDAA